MTSARRSEVLRTLFITAVVVGFGLQLLLLLMSEGSNDIRTWKKFATAISQRGVIQLYLDNTLFNHPPLMGLYAAACLDFATAVKLPFALIFKLPMVLANGVGAAVLALALKKRGFDLTAQWGGAAVAALSLSSMLIAAHHGNTDTLCALLVLIAVVLVDDGEHPWWAGFAFAAALNVKLIPLVLAPVLLIMQARSWRHTISFCLAVGLGLLPFLAPVLEVGPAFYKNAIAYNSHRNRWGIHFPLYEIGQAWPQLKASTTKIDDAWATIARYIILGSGALYAAWSRFKQRPAREPAAIALALFLILAPGIGVQYFCFPVLVMALVDRKRAFLYALFSGLFIGATYVHFSTLSLPLQSIHSKPIPVSAGLIGVLAWVSLVEFVWRVSRSSRTEAV